MGLFSKKDKEEKPSFNDIFDKIQSNLNKYFSLRIQYLKLDLDERLSKLAGIITFGLLVSGIVLCFFLFAFLSIAFLLGRVFHNEAIGFGIVAGIWLLSFILFIALRKKIRNYFVNLFVGIFYNVLMPKTKEERNDDREYQSQNGKEDSNA